MNLEDIFMTGDEKPTITLIVNGKALTFLCDTGACRTAWRDKIPNLIQGKGTVMVRECPYPSQSKYATQREDKLRHQS